MAFSIGTLLFPILIVLHYSRKFPLSNSLKSGVIFVEVLDFLLLVGMVIINFLYDKRIIIGLLCLQFICKLLGVVFLVLQMKLVKSIAKSQKLSNYG
ncbi:hypothetical protein [Streptococcus sobrinus]|uniref:hypothetical protein n=1 Tax=Streptococcus sobrinus TaxID=1310 RepID=UPI00036A03D7|nr:hypothetical protein [Streptococcus sobrinus]